MYTLKLITVATTIFETNVTNYFPVIVEAKKVYYF